MGVSVSKGGNVSPTEEAPRLANTVAGPGPDVRATDGCVGYPGDERTGAGEQVRIADDADPGGIARPGLPEDASTGPAPSGTPAPASSPCR